MSADIVSAAQQLNQSFGYALQAVFTTSGTLAGTLSLQCSTDHKVDLNGNITNAGHWDVISYSEITLTAAGSHTWNVSSPMYPFVRLVYTHHSGDTGVLNAQLFERAF